MRRRIIVAGLDALERWERHLSIRGQMTDVLAKITASTADMIRLPGGTFRMGSDEHYVEEAPAHTVAVDGFWIDPEPVTNAQFRKFVEATSHVTWAEIVPDAKDYPGALPRMPKAGGLDGEESAWGEE